MSINVGCKESSIKTFFNKSEKVNKDNEDIKKYDNFINSISKITNKSVLILFNKKSK